MVRSVLETGDPVLFSAAETLLRAAGVSHRILNNEAGAMICQQILVGDDDYIEARRILRDGLVSHRPKDTEP